MKKVKLFSIVCILFLTGLVTAGITNATGTRLEFSSTDFPSGNNATSNALGVKLTISSNPMSPSPQQNGLGAKLSPQFPNVSNQTNQAQQVTNRWIVR